jgi:hypothetical protein
VIDAAIDFVRKETARYLKLDDDLVIINSARKLVDESNGGGVYISLVNVQEEATLRNQPHTERRLGVTHYREPPVFLNLYLLFAFNAETYSKSLLQLSGLVELFQNQRWFSSETQSAPGATAFPDGLDKVVFEMVNMNFEELNNLWGVLGGSYFPSVVYRMRLIKVQADTSEVAPEITTIQLDTLPR